MLEVLKDFLAGCFGLMVIIGYMYAFINYPKVAGIIFLISFCIVLGALLRL